MKRLLALCVTFLVLCLMVFTSLVAVPVRSQSPPNVLLIGWDGAGRVEVKQLLAEGKLPNLQSIIDEGTVVAIDILRETDTKAGWSQILTGYNPEKNKVWTNDVWRPIPAGYTILERVEQEYGDKNVFTAFIASKGVHLRQPYRYIVRGIDFYQNALGENANVYNLAIAKLEAEYQQQFFFFVHFQEPDLTGHHWGEASPQYCDAIVDDDYYLGLLIEELRQLDIYQNSLIYVTSDHGFDTGRNEHKDAPYSWLASNDTSIIRRGDRVDVAPTIYQTLGIDWQAFDPPLDGYPLNLSYNPPNW